MAFLGLVSWGLFVDACRLASICLFLLCSLSFSWYSFFSLICVIVSLYVLDRNKYAKTTKQSLDLGGNPYRRKRRVKDDDKIPPEVTEKYVAQILDLVLYDVENNKAIADFEPVKLNTECIFALKARLWGACDYDRSLSLERNVTRSLPGLMKFLAVGPSLHLDGFVFELPGDEFGKDINSFGQGVRRVLKHISDHDPSGFHCMNKSYVSKIGWSFEFNGVPIFVTTFAPCYPDTHSRYSFGTDNAFILFQPMYSFAIHDIGRDTPHTNWECPVTVRDRIRVAYKENNREYFIRDTIVYPTAHDIVKPLKEGVGDLVEWWRDPNQKEADEEDEESKLIGELEALETESESEEEEEVEEGEPEEKKIQ